MTDIQLRSTTSNLQYVLQVSINENRCIGIPSLATPLLRVGLTIARTAQNQPTLEGHLVGGSLSWWEHTEAQRLTSIPPTPIAFSLANGGPTSVPDLDIPLAYRVIEAIEILRNLRDVTFSIHLWISCTFEQPPHSQTKLVTFSGEAALRIPKSIWVEEILPRLARQQFHLLQISVSRSSSHEFLRKALEELKKAEANLQKDYEDAVGDCRKAIQPLIDETNRSSKAEKLADKLKEWCKVQLSAKVGETTSEYLAEQLYALWNFTSRPHHSSPPYHRRDASLAVGTVAILLSYVVDTLEESQ